MGSVTGGGNYEKGATATLTATPNDGYDFVKWSDGNKDNPRSFTVVADVTLTAIFEQKSSDPEEIYYTLTVEIEPAGTGSVLFDGQKITANSKTVKEGEIITLTTEPEEGYEFSYFLEGQKRITDDMYKVTMDKNKTVKVYFEEIQESIDQITNNQLPMTNKIIKDNQLLILRGEKVYTVTGQEVR